MSTTFSRMAALAVLTAVSVVSLNAQGPGTVTLGPFDTEAISGGAGSNLGVQYHPARNTIFVTGRGNVAGGPYVGTAPHSIFEFDLSGTLLNTWLQSSSGAVTTSVWGHRDMACDGNLIFAGDEDGIHCFNPATGLYETNPIVQTGVGPFNYTFPLPVPIGTATPIATARGLAYNPQGNGGLGSFWVGDFGSDIVEIDLNGTILTTLPANGTWSTYGLAWDPNRQLLWVSTSPNQGNLAEIDPVTGAETGFNLPRFAAGAQGGMCFMQRGGSTPWTELLVMVQGAPDTVAAQRLELYDPTGGGGYRDEAVFQTDVNGGGFDTLPKFIEDNDTLSWQFGTASPVSAGLPPQPTIVMLSFGADAQVNANTLGIPEFVTPNTFSVPAATPFLTYELGGPLGGLLATPVPLGPNLLTDPAASVPVPPGIFSIGDTLRLQAFVLDFGVYPGGSFPGYATNTVSLNYLSPPCFLEDFETATPGVPPSYPTTGWINGPGGTDEWRAGTGATPSGGTGPAGALDGLVYMFCEASGPQNSWPKTFVMDSPPITLCGGGALTFGVHLTGSTSGTLTVQDLDSLGNPISTLATITGDQGPAWNNIVVPGVTADPVTGALTLRFTYVTPAANNSWVGDCALDRVAIR